MIFKVSKGALVKGVQTAGRAVSSRGSLPILEGVHCLADDTGVTLTGYNMELGIRAQVEAEVREDGACVLPARLFSDIVRRMPDGDITVKVDEKYNVKVTGGTAAITVKAESALEYPNLPGMDQIDPITVKQKDLKALISGTAFAVSTSMARPVHTGVEIRQDGGGLTAAAIDGFRLAVRRCPVAFAGPGDLAMVVPGTSLREIEKVLMDSDDLCEIDRPDKWAVFRAGAVTVAAKTLEGSFMDWRKVCAVGVAGSRRVTVDVGAMIAAAERVGMIVNEKNKAPLRCVFSEDEVYMRANTAMGTSSDTCPVEGDGGEVEIGLNVRYLLDALKATGADTVVLEIKDELSRLLILPERGDEFLYLVLPVRLKKG